MKSKKMMAGILTVSLLVTAAALPSLAEGNNTAMNGTAVIVAKGGQPGNNRNQQGQMPGNGQNQFPSNNGQNQRGPQQGQMPGNGQNQFPGNNGQNQQTPPQGQQLPGNQNQNPGNGMRNGRPGQRNQQQNQQQGVTPNTTTPDNGTQDAQTPDTNDQNTQDTQTIKQPGRNGKFQRGNRGQRPGKQLDLKALVEQGIIDQETADKIEEYLKQNTPSKPDGVTGATSNGNQTPTEGTAPVEGTTPTDLPADGQAPEEGTTPPEKPDGEQAPTAGENPPELPADVTAQEGDLVAKLVEAGILTQEQAEAINGMNTTTETETAATTEEAAING